MKELIDKAEVVTEIEGYISNYKDIVAKTDRNDSSWVDSVSMIDAKIGVLQHLLSFLNTLEVKEVDLEKEVDDYVNEYFSECDDGVLISDANSMELTLLDITPLAKHFFELGMQQSKNDNNNDEKKVIETLIPELKESEDERIRKSIIAIINNYVDNSNTFKPKMLAWLDKQGKPKWTDEDSSMQLTLMRDIEQVSFISKEGKDERIMWLNKLDDRFHQNTNDIQKSKWTEEDDKNLESIDIILFEYKDLPKENYWKMINWLKSLKQRMEQ